jgi:hypothetical protein
VFFAYGRVGVRALIPNPSPLANNTLREKGADL